MADTRYILGYKCTICGKFYKEDEASLTCPECGEFFDIHSYGNRWECRDCGCWWDKKGIIEHGKKYKEK